MKLHNNCRFPELVVGCFLYLTSASQDDTSTVPYPTSCRHKVRAKDSRVFFPLQYYWGAAALHVRTKLLQGFVVWWWPNSERWDPVVEGYVAGDHA